MRDQYILRKALFVQVFSIHLLDRSGSQDGSYSLRRRVGTSTVPRRALWSRGTVESNIRLSKCEGAVSAMKVFSLSEIVVVALEAVGTEILGGWTHDKCGFDEPETPETLQS